MVYVMMMVRFPNDDDGACNDDGGGEHGDGDVEDEGGEDIHVGHFPTL